MHTYKNQTKSIIYFISVIILLFFTLATAQAAVSSLPGGTSISVSIAEPANGSEFTAETNSSGEIQISGMATVGVGTTHADTTLIYVLDASGSTEGSSGMALSCPDQNPSDVDPGDPVPDENEIIDCEIGAAIALNDQAAALGNIDEVAVIMFAGDAVTAVSSPDGNDTFLVAPNADKNSNGTHDVDEVLQSIQVAYLFGHDSGFDQFSPQATPDIVKTDYADALQEVGEIAAQSSNPNIIVMFISDGVNNAGTNINSVLPLNIPDKHIVFHTFAIPDSFGFGGQCDSDKDGLGSLQAIVDMQNELYGIDESQCSNIANPSDLPNILPRLILPSLDNLHMRVDDGEAVVLPYENMALSLPQDGPVDVSFETAVSNLTPGEHQICITATGTDMGGNGAVTECTLITISAPQNPMEFGDAPDSYGSTLVEDGARHADYSMEWLGLTVDGEPDALSEDLSDDGLIMDTSHYPNRRMFATITTSGLGAARYGIEADRRLYLNVWIDYNQDGDWDDADELAVTCDVAPGTTGQCNGKPTNWRHADQASIQFPIKFRLRSTNEGPTWIRARLTYGEPAGSPTGIAQFGEVEDYEEVIFQR